MAQEPQRRGQVHEREVGLERIELFVLGQDRRGEEDAQEQARQRRAAPGPHGTLGVTTIWPFIRPWPEPQYSEHLKS